MDVCKFEIIRSKVLELLHDRAPLIAGDAKLDLLATSLLDAEDVLRLLRLWGRSARLCNMALERLLARYRKSCRQRSTVDRQICAGYLSEVRGLHLSAGGICSSTMTRAKMIAMGCGELCLSKTQKKRLKYEKKKKKKTHTWGVWSSRMIKAKQAAMGRKLKRGEYIAEIDTLGKRWRRYIDDGVAPPVPEVPVEVAKKKRKNQVAAEDYNAAIGNDLLGLSDVLNCIRPEIVRDELHDVIASSGGASVREGGWTNPRMGAYRDEFINGLYFQHGLIYIYIYIYVLLF